MSGDYTQAKQISLRIDAPILKAIEKDAASRHRDITDFMQWIIENYAVYQRLVSEEAMDEYKLRWSLVDRAAEKARQILEEQRFDREITYKTFQSCMADKAWAADYEKYVRDNPYKNGNPRKGINKKIGNRIARAVGAVAIKGPDGRPEKKPVATRSYRASPC